MNANEKQTVNLTAGQALTITAAAGVIGSVVRLTRMPGGGNAQSVTAINGANLTFGPYADLERFEVSCTAGTVTITMATPDPADMASDAEVAALLVGKMDKLGNDVTFTAGDGVPVDYTDGTPPATGEGVSGPGSLYIDFAGKKLYINGGTKAQPVWKLVTSA